uniref:Uncharacterized protein n=1 Tax=Anopheles culicifacies TaxID=139723 RepID=A0A182M4E5_9DIPT
MLPRGRCCEGTRAAKRDPFSRLAKKVAFNRLLRRSPCVENAPFKHSFLNRLLATINAEEFNEETNQGGGFYQGLLRIRPIALSVAQPSVIESVKIPKPKSVQVDRSVSRELRCLFLPRNPLFGPNQTLMLVTTRVLVICTLASFWFVYFYRLGAADLFISIFVDPGDRVREFVSRIKCLC